MDDYMLNTPFDFIREPTEVLKALLESKDRGTAIGIKSDILDSRVDQLLEALEQVKVRYPRKTAAGR